MSQLKNGNLEIKYYYSYYEIFDKCTSRFDKFINVENLVKNSIHTAVGNSYIGKGKIFTGR